MVLLEHIEQLAQEQGIDVVFALTTRAAHWFLEKGFSQTSVEHLPADIAEK